VEAGIGNAAGGLMNLRRGPDYVEKDTGYKTLCWIWVGAVNNKGYGVTTKGCGYNANGHQKARLAHIVYYEKAVGLVPKGLELDHLCGTPLCINPAHQEPVSHTENLRRGRRTKLTLEIAIHIRAEYEASGHKHGKLSALARQFRVCQPTIKAVITGRTWKTEV
jgi:hypothetical protein